MKLVVYLPALNEAATIGGVLDGIPESLPGGHRIDRLVVDDGSTDETVAIARRHGAAVVSHGRNLGTGRAFMSGVDAALARGADIIVGMDADGQFRGADVIDLVEPILSGRADVVLCTRFGGVQMRGRMPPVKRLGNRLLSWIVGLVARRPLTDVCCGFRAMTREAALRVAVHSDYEYVHESILTWSRMGMRIHEVGLAVMAERPVGQSRMLTSLGHYVVRSAPVLLTAVRDHSPLRFFGGVSLLAFVPSVLIGAGVLIHWIRTGETVPYTSFITISVGGVLLSFLLGTLALVADLVARLREQLDELLYQSRRLRHAGADDVMASEPANDTAARKSPARAGAQR